MNFGYLVLFTLRILLLFLQKYNTDVRNFSYNRCIVPSLCLYSNDDRDVDRFEKAFASASGILIKFQLLIIINPNIKFY